MWIRVPRNIFLAVGAVVGVFVAAPIVASYATVWWWLSVPLIAAYVVVLWRWGLAWIADDQDVASAPLAAKVVGVLILLGWSAIGVTLLVYLGMLAVRYWADIVMSLIVLAVLVPVLWLMTREKKKPPAAPAPANLPGDAPSDDIVR